MILLIEQAGVTEATGFLFYAGLDHYNLIFSTTENPMQASVHITEGRKEANLSFGPSSSLTLTLCLSSL